MNPEHPKHISQIGAFRWEALTVDPNLQRRLDDSHVNRINRHYNEAAVGVPVVSARADGTKVIIDGQHRWAAAIKGGRGDELIKCEVYCGLTRNEEGRMFKKLNTRKAVQALDQFRIDVNSNDPEAIEINQILIAAGLRAAHGGDGTISCVAALQDVYRGTLIKDTSATHGNLLMDVIATLQATWGINRDAYEAALIKAAALVLHNHGHEIDRDRLARLLAKSGSPAQTLGRAKVLRDATRAGLPKAASQVMIDVYNHGRRSGRIGAL